MVGIAVFLFILFVISCPVVKESKGFKLFSLGFRRGVFVVAPGMAGCGIDTESC